MTEGDLDTLASLCRYLETIYGSLLVYGHMDWKATACPGRYYDRLPEVIAEINNVEIAPVSPVPVGPNTPTVHCCCHD
jgi:hypothetical protein